MEKSKEKILEYMHQALGTGINKVLLVSKSPAEEGALIHGIPRIGLILDGEIEYRSFQDQKLKTTVCKASDAYYCSKNGYLYANLNNISKSFSICYYGEFIRAVYSEYNASSKPEFEVYYHTNTALSAAGQKLLEALDEIEKDREYAKNAPKLLEILLLTTIEDIKRSNPGGLNPSGRLWVEIDLYMRLHYNAEITRKSVAEKFNISPSYLSHLTKKITGNDFTSLLTEHRLTHACKLLRQTRRSIDEIAERAAASNTLPTSLRALKRIIV